MKHWVRLGLSTLLSVGYTKTIPGYLEIFWTRKDVNNHLLSPAPLLPSGCKKVADVVDVTGGRVGMGLGLDGGGPKMSTKFGFPPF